MTTLTRNQSKILRYLIKEASCNPNHHINIDNNAMLCSLTPHRVHSAMFMLDEYGYINAIFFDTSTDILVTPAGFEYFDLAQHAFREHVRDLAMSKGLDIVVSAITAFITAVLTYFIMPHLQELLMK